MGDGRGERGGEEDNAVTMSDVDVAARGWGRGAADDARPRQHDRRHVRLARPADTIGEKQNRLKPEKSARKQFVATISRGS